MRSYFSKRVAAAPAKPAREPGVDASAGCSKCAVANELRRQIFGRLFETIENEGAEGLSDDTEIREYIDELIHDARQSGRADFTAAQWQDLRREVLDEIQGL